MSPTIELRDVCKTYMRGTQRVDVLRGLNMQARGGEFIALMGPSGSGKTTLLNLIAGLDRCTSGCIEIAGQRIDTLSRNALAAWRSQHVGFVFQFYNLLPALTAEHNVEVPLLLTSLSARQRRNHAAAALDLVGLSDRAKHKPGELSGGQQQRVAIARAMVADPTLLVCDEPTGDLDRENADQILELLQALNSTRGKTIVMVTHDPLAARHATRKIHMDKGRVAEVLRAA